MSELIIETKGLTKSFGNFTAVENLNLKVKKGSLYGFLGPNGAGKSTTIRMLLDLVKPTKGEAYLFNKEIRSHRKEILRRVGTLVESPSYYENLTAYENLEIIRRILELLILDEPTNGLDPAGVREIRNLIISLPQMTGATVLISSHILSEIELIADHLGIINKGKLLFQGTIEELKQKANRDIVIKAEPLYKAEAFLKEKGYTLENREGRLHIYGNKIRIEELNKELVLNGFEVSHLSENKKNLEELFLQMTRGIEEC